MTRIERNLISLDLPNDWEMWDQNGFVNTDTLFSAKIKDNKWPNIEVTKIGQVKSSDVIDTQKFSHHWLRKYGLKLISERFLTVTGRDAYEFCYFEKNFMGLIGFGGKTYICKISVIRAGIEYLIQLGSKDLKKDKPIFDKIVSSMRFEYATEGLDFTK